MQRVGCKGWFFLLTSISNLNFSGPGRKGGLVPGVSPDGFDDGVESKAVVDDYKFKLQKAEQDINTLQTNVSTITILRTLIMCTNWKTHLSKSPSDLKQNATQKMTPFSGTVFNTLSHGVKGCHRFVASVGSKNTF